MTHLDELRRTESVIADVIEENKDLIKGCTGDCLHCEAYEACQPGKDA